MQSYVLMYQIECMLRYEFNYVIFKWLLCYYFVQVVYNGEQRWHWKNALGRVIIIVILLRFTYGHHAHHHGLIIFIFIR